MKRYAVGFQQQGIGPADRLCAHLRNSLENLAAMYGCIFTGATLVLAKTSLTKNETDTVLASAPIGHLSGLLLGLMAVLDGSVCVLAQPGLNLQEITELADEHNITSMFSFPTRLQTLAEEMLRDGKQSRSNRRIGVAGGVLSQATYDAAFKAFENLDSLVIMYTMTESGGIVCSTSLYEAVGIGMGFPGAKVDIKVVHPVSRVKLGPNEPGEICFLKPTLMRGYYKRPKETTEFFEGNGSCRSGDIGYYDEDGRFYFVQRLKEMIKCMDDQVVPAEL
ncbi:putative 4-coumarate--CoA ligase 2 [Rhipicephalus microplus]|uniref:putative 4-coumarate--CoA ligase 2 n=1 Tax=Rhipicephalus microplus TaxID=6941 RepID=UPI003F6BE87A